MTEKEIKELELKHNKECFDDMVRNNIPISVEHLSKLMKAFFECDVKTGQIYKWLVTNNHYKEVRTWNRATRSTYVLKYIPEDLLLESNAVIQKNDGDFHIATSFVLYIYPQLLKEFGCNNT